MRLTNIIPTMHLVTERETIGYKEPPKLWSHKSTETGRMLENFAAIKQEGQISEAQRVSLTQK